MLIVKRRPVWDAVGLADATTKVNILAHHDIQRVYRDRHTYFDFSWV